MKMITSAVCGVLPLSAVAHGQTFQSLPTPTGQSFYRSGALAISDSGERIVGYVNASTGFSLPAYWTPGGTTYSTLDVGGLVSSNGVAYVVSPDETIIAGIANNTGFTEPRSGPARWVNGVRTILTVPEGLYQAPITTMSADGQVMAATLGVLDQVTRATVWHGATSTVVPLPPGADRSRAGAVLADGAQLIGTAGAPNGTWVLFSWSVAGGTQVIAQIPYPGEASVAEVSADGLVVVGNAGDTAFRFSGGQFQSLGLFSVGAANADLSVVIGGYETSLVRWTAGTGAQPLLPWLQSQGIVLNGYTLLSVSDMTPNGRRLVGGGRTSGGQFTGFVITLPEAGACYANCDGSTTQPVLNVADFTCFLQRFAAGESYANCDGSTATPVLNVADFTCFLQGFAAGCP